MWSDADALAETNTALLANFVEGMRLANLKPTRFLLQTGAKVHFRQAMEAPVLANFP